MTHFTFPAKLTFAFEFFLAFFHCRNQLSIDAFFLHNFLFGFDFLVAKFTTPAMVA